MVLLVWHPASVEERSTSMMETKIVAGFLGEGWRGRQKGKSMESDTGGRGNRTDCIFFRNGKRGGREWEWDCKVSFFKKMEIIFSLT
jgi:hypothetical protein